MALWAALALAESAGLFRSMVVVGKLTKMWESIRSMDHRGVMDIRYFSIFSYFLFPFTLNDSIS